MADGHNFVYSEGDHRLLIRGEMMTDDLNFVIYPHSMEDWMAPYETETKGTAKKELILAKLGEWLSREGIIYELEE
jgi:hypothetical protein